MGLGVWTHLTQRYYPLQLLQDHHNSLIDQLDGQGLLVYVEPRSRVPSALYTRATACAWEDPVIKLNTGDVLRNGTVYDPHGRPMSIVRPMQVFTRWYGFAYTFPGCEIWAPATDSLGETLAP